MKNKIIITFLLVAILILCGVASMYLGGYVLLKISGVDVSSLGLNTFFEVINSLGGDPKYKKLVALGWLGFAAPYMALLFFIALVVIGLMPKKVIYGDGRLATPMDLSRSGFFPKKGDKNKFPPILIGKMFKGKYKGSYIYFFGQQFLILYAPTRSGKGVGIVIPNCVNYPESIVVLDIKLENFFLSAGYRKSQGQECFLFSPDGFADSLDAARRGEIKSHRFNPLDYVSRSPLQRESDLKKIAAILYPTSGGENDTWNESASSLWVGLALYLLDMEKVEPKTKVAVSQIIKISVPGSGDPLEKWMELTIKAKSDILGDDTKQYFRKFMSAADRTRASILVNFNNGVAVFSNPITAAATDSSDFDLRDLRKKKMSVYLGLSPNSLVTHAKLVNLFFSLLVNENTKELPENNPELKYQCLLILDEFTSMGRVEIIQKAVGFTAGYNIRFMFILQNKGQLEDDQMYGKEGAETFIENTGVELYYPPKTVNNTAKAISEKIGKRDIKVNSKSRSSSSGKISRSDSTNTEGRAVLLPEEIVSLRDHKNKTGGMAVREIILSDYCRPFIANKIIYFEEPIFMERVNFSRKNPVEIPFVFNEDERNSFICDSISLGSVMKKPVLDEHLSSDESD
ncbi:conjugal transfer protein TraK [Aeromonas veronii]|uniref:type IV secretory system conjugative DNA transfer family protein n=1 Tax=Aeromonas veronii TaxID=654 RepID=UPI000946BE88|nr:type IV secretory system conjugative DNA transfer family protein [Aeromonas veronii]OLF56808.1 conjugal transfer protein TraK [Aeromonas veronii]